MKYRSTNDMYAQEYLLFSSSSSPSSVNISCRTFYLNSERNSRKIVFTINTLTRKQDYNPMNVLMISEISFNLQNFPNKFSHNFQYINILMKLWVIWFNAKDVLTHTISSSSINKYLFLIFLRQPFTLSLYKFRSLFLFHCIFIVITFLFNMKCEIILDR